MDSGVAEESEAMVLPCVIVGVSFYYCRIFPYNIKCFLVTVIELKKGAVFKVSRGFVQE